MQVRKIKTAYGAMPCMTKMSEARKSEFDMRWAKYPLRTEEVIVGYGVFGKNGWNVLEAKSDSSIKSATLEVARKLAAMWNRRK